MDCNQAKASRGWKYLARLASVSADIPTQILLRKNKNVYSCLPTAYSGNNDSKLTLQLLLARIHY